MPLKKHAKYLTVNEREKQQHEKYSYSYSNGLAVQKNSTRSKTSTHSVNKNYVNCYLAMATVSLRQGAYE